MTITRAPDARLSVPPRPHNWGTASPAASSVPWLPSSLKRDVLPSVSQRLRHPDQLAEKLVGPADEGGVEQLPGLIEYLAHATDVQVPEDRHQTELPKDGERALDHPGTSERPGG